MSWGSGQVQRKVGRRRSPGRRKLPALAPCPHYGHTGADLDVEVTGGQFYQVVCRACPCKGPLRLTAAGAVTAWAHRVGGGAA